MLNLFRGECYKLWRNKPFYICTLVGACLALLLYGSLLLLDGIRNTDSGQGGSGFSVAVEANEEAEHMDGGEYMPISEKIGVTGVIEQMLSGSFVSFIIALFASIFTIGEYSNGTVKNVVGKGHSRRAVFLSKFLATELAALLMALLIVGATLLLGAAFFGKAGIQAIHWGNLAVFTGMQLVFLAALTGVIILVGEVARSLAAGISISIGIVMFSTSLTAGLDLLFHNLGWKPSAYWLLDLQTSGLSEFLSQDFLVRGAIISLAWLLAAAIAGMAHFEKADIK